MKKIKIEYFTKEGSSYPYIYAEGRFLKRIKAACRLFYEMSDKTIYIFVICILLRSVKIGNLYIIFVVYNLGLDVIHNFINESTALFHQS